jgi:hypothetical protein
MLYNKFSLVFKKILYLKNIPAKFVLLASERSHVKTRFYDTQFTMIRVPFLIWNIFVKRSMQIRLVLTKKDQFEAFCFKKYYLSNNGHFFGLLVVSFDPVNQFSSFKNHYTPNF